MRAIGDVQAWTGDAKSVIGDNISTIFGTIFVIGDAFRCFGDVISAIVGTDRAIGDMKSPPVIPQIAPQTKTTPHIEPTIHSSCSPDFRNL